MRKRTAYFKSFLSVVLMMSVLLMMTPVWGMTGDSEEHVDENADIPIDGYEKVNGVYEIYTAAAFKELLCGDNPKLSCSFVLKQCIDLGNDPFTPIGKFTGTFDGDGHEIKGLSIATTDTKQSGLFEQVDKGTIKNLTVRGKVSSTSTNSSVGGIVGKSTNGSQILDCTSYVEVTGSGNMIGGIVGECKDTKIEGCKNYFPINGTGTYDSTSNSVGGIVGKNYNSGNTKNCHNFGEVTGGSSVGGIAGVSADVIVEDCTNNNKVNGNNMVGGIVGENKSATIEGCTNKASVNGDGTSTSDYVGGIVGKNGNSTDIGTVRFCLNEGPVSGTSDVGGIVGRNDKGTIGGSDKETDGCTNNEAVSGIGDRIGGVAGSNGDTIEGCTNKALVNGYGTVNENGTETEIKTSNNVGGVVGNNGGTINKCTNNAAVTGNGNYVGGVVGKNGNIDKDPSKNVSGEVLSCENKGDVNGVSDVGGVAGRNELGTITECVNSNTNAKVIGTGDRVGGIAGSNNGKVELRCINYAEVSGAGSVGGVVGENKGTVEVCYNTGNVTGTGNNVGGVVGDSYSKVEICYNIGKQIKGADTVGGVVGHNYQTAELQNCYNTGKVDGNSNVGGIVGDNAIDTVINCYNIGEVSGTSNFGTALGKNTGSIKNCFYFAKDPKNSELIAIGDGDFGNDNGNAPLPKSADEFKDQTTFDNSDVNWDFDDGVYWEMGVFKNENEENENVRPILTQIPEKVTPLPRTDGNDDDNTPGDSDNTPGEGGNTPGEGGNTPGEGGNTTPGEGGNTPGDGGNTPGGDNNGNNGNNGNDDSNGDSEPSPDNSEPSDSTVPGDVNIGTESGENAPDVTISEETSSALKEEVINEHLTDEDKSALESGDDLDIILRIEDAEDTVPDGDRQAAEEAAADKGFTVGGYLEADLIKRRNGAEVGKITETNSPIRVTIEIPEELRKANRDFTIVRIIDGVAEILEDIDDDPDTITILTDRFSVYYSIAYKDPKPANPNTGAPVTALALAVAVSAAAVTFRRNKIIE